MSLQYYTKMMKALWSEKFLTADEMCDKDVLLVGLPCFGSALVSVLQQPFFAAGAKVDYAPLFNEHIGVSSSLAQLEENVGGKKYDIVVLLEGLEKEPHFVRSAEALAACCRLGGKLLCFSCRRRTRRMRRSMSNASWKLRGRMTCRTSRAFFRASPCFPTCARVLLSCLRQDLRSEARKGPCARRRTACA